MRQRRAGRSAGQLDLRHDHADMGNRDHIARAHLVYRVHKARHARRDGVPAFAIGGRYVTRGFPKRARKLPVARRDLVKRQAVPIAEIEFPQRRGIGKTFAPVGQGIGGRLCPHQVR